jgi:hypothetical protein
VRVANELRGWELEQHRLDAVRIEIDRKEPLGTARASSKHLHRLPKIGLMKFERNLAIGTTQRSDTIVRRGATRNKLE